MLQSDSGWRLLQCDFDNISRIELEIFIRRKPLIAFVRSPNRRYVGLGTFAADQLGCDDSGVAQLLLRGLQLRREAAQLDSRVLQLFQQIDFSLILTVFQSP